MLGFKGVNGIIYERILSWDIRGNIKDRGKLLVKISKMIYQSWDSKQGIVLVVLVVNFE